MVHLFEVSPRDGFQNELIFISTQKKIGFIRGLINSGIKRIELGSFVRKDLVPQMADTAKVYKAILSGQLQLGDASAWCLVPNCHGLDCALKVGATGIAVVTAATESFSKKNIGMSIQDSLDEIKILIPRIRTSLGKNTRIRGYISMAFGCPFEGRVSYQKVIRIIIKLIKMGIDEISIGDTIGVATPRDVTNLLKPLREIVDFKRIAVHFHDTYGMALANVLRALDLGVRIIDSSAGGLGGCPFAHGAFGNLATEDLVYMLEGMGVKTGVNLKLLAENSLKLSQQIRRPLTSRYLQALKFL